MSIQQLSIKTVTVHYFNPWIDNHFRFKKNNIIFGIKESGTSDILDIIQAISDLKKNKSINQKCLHDILRKSNFQNIEDFSIKITYFNINKKTVVKINKDFKIDEEKSKNLKLIDRLNIKIFKDKESLDKLLETLYNKRKRVKYLKNRIVVLEHIETLYSQREIVKLLDFLYRYANQAFCSTLSPRIIVHALNNYQTRNFNVTYMVNHMEKNIRPNVLQELTQYSGEKINKKVIFVEGISDRLVLENIFFKKKIKDLVVIDTGGISNINLESIRNLNHFLLAKAIIDSDNQKDRISSDLIYVLKRKAIEWYLDKNVLHRYKLNDFKMSSHYKVLMAEKFKNTYFKSQNYPHLEKEVLSLYNSFDKQK